jgi:hypothetical protein
VERGWLRVKPEAICAVRSNWQIKHERGNKMSNQWVARERLEVPLLPYRYAYVARRTGFYGDGTFYWQMFGGVVYNKSAGNVDLVLQSSMDNINWTTVATLSGLVPGATVPFAYSYTGNYVRLMAYSTKPGLLAFEHDVMEPFTPPYLYADVLDPHGEESIGY